jgi:hypothetical protein
VYAPHSPDTCTSTRPTTDTFGYSDGWRVPLPVARTDSLPPVTRTPDTLYGLGVAVVVVGGGRVGRVHVPHDTGQEEATAVVLQPRNDTREGHLVPSMQLAGVVV